MSFSRGCGGTKLGRFLDIAKVPAVHHLASMKEPALSGKSSPILRDHVDVIEAASTAREGTAW